MSHIADAYTGCTRELLHLLKRTDHVEKGVLDPKTNLANSEAE